MEIIKKTAEFEIIKKRSGRYGVRDAQQKWLSGDEKVKILLAEKLIKAPAPKTPEPEPEAAEASADATNKSAPAEASAEAAPAEPAAEPAGK